MYKRQKDIYLVKRKREADLEAAISDTSLELNTYVDKAASSVGVKIDESSELLPVDGARYRQRGLEIKLRKLTLRQLTRFLSELERSRSHIVHVTEMTINSRYYNQDREREELDAELVVSTYEKATEKERNGKKRRGRRS